jgi:hypothetical protein
MVAKEGRRQAQSLTSTQRWGQLPQLNGQLTEVSWKCQKQNGKIYSGKSKIGKEKTKNIYFSIPDTNLA